MLDFLKSGKPDRISSLADVSPEYADLTRRHAELIERKYANIQGMREIGKRHGNAPPAFPKPEPGAAAISRLKRVAALVGLDQPASGNDDDADSQRYWALHRENEEIDEALPQVAAKLREATRAASAIVCEGLREEHESLVGEIAATLQELHELNAKYWAIADHLAREGIGAGALGLVFMRFAGHPSDRYGPIGQWFRDAVELGHIKSSEIPESLR